MANEITTQIITRCINPAPNTTTASLKAEFDLGVFQLTQTTAAVLADTVTVGFGAEQVITIPTSSKFTAALQGIFCAVNLDATNYVKLGPESAGAMVEVVRLYPRYMVQMPVTPSVVLRWRADTAACSVRYVWFAK